MLSRAKLVALGAAALAFCLVTLTVGLGRPVSLFSNADLAIIDSAEDKDSSTQSLASKNDDGHTKMWNAASDGSKLSSVLPGSLLRPAAAAAARPRAVARSGGEGMPMFYSRSTGYVDDVSPMKGGGILKGTRTQILVSDAGVRDIDKWETAMLRSSYPDADANPKEAAAADKREARLAAGLKKFALMASAKQGKTTKLWNAAANDEITSSSIGHMHPSEPAEIARLSPEAKIAAHKAHVTNAKHMSFHPMSWLHHQRAPAVASHSSTPTKMAAAAEGGARFQSLWNAGANDDVEGVFAEDDSSGFHPLKWLANQHDRTEMKTLGKLSDKDVGMKVGSVSSPGRVFSERANHGRNFEGSYVEDNSIGIKVDEMKGRDTMLVQLPVRQHLEQVDVTNHTAMEDELDRLIDMSTGAYNSLPPAANPVVRGIATDDTQMIIDYLDNVASVTTGVPRGNYNESAGFSLRQDGAPSLPALAAAANHNVGPRKLVSALQRGVGGTFSRLKEELTVEKATGNNEGAKTVLVLKALAEAKAKAIEIMTNAAYAEREAKMEDTTIDE